MDNYSFPLTLLFIPHMDLQRGHHLLGLGGVLRLGEAGLALGLGRLEVAEEVRHAVHGVQALAASLALTCLQIIVFLKLSTASSNLN